jgi:hypothetical protein
VAVVVVIQVHTQVSLGEAVLEMVVVMAGVSQATGITIILRAVAVLVVTLAMEVLPLRAVAVLVAAAVAVAVLVAVETVAVAAVSGF